MSRGAFLSAMTSYYGKRYLIAIAAAFVALMALGPALDIRFCVLALMVIFILLPMVVAMLYYFHGLKEGCYLNVADHTLAMTDTGVEVRMFFRLRKEESEDDETQDEEVNDNEPEYIERKVFIPFDDLGRYKVWKDSVTIEIRGGSGGFLWIPYNPITQ